MKNLNLIILTLIVPLLLSGQTGYESNSLYVKFDNSGKQSSLLSASNNGYMSLPLINDKLFRNVDLTPRGDSLLNELRNVRRVIFPGKVDIAKISSMLNKDKSIIYAERIPKAELLIGESDDPQLGSQYHLFITQIAESWENLTGDTVLAGVVDTGIDFEHEDLVNTNWVNPGESGLDENGEDKRINLRDDDGNGYVDDWRGWDFGSESGKDNDPTFANDHGVHVAGIVAAEVDNGIGVAGVAPRVKLLNVKIGSDNGLDRSVYNQFEGLLYAGAMGCRVINCSWGSSGYSQTDADVVRLVNEMGALIVAAAGNNGSDLKFYPAGYDGVLSVASTADDDRKSGFSNYHTSVGVSAPGSFVLATTPNSTYDYKSGTSMASPVVAGVAAVLMSEFPEYNAEEIKHLIMVNADDISEINSSFNDKIGRGRVNLRKALERVNLKSVALDSYGIINLNGAENILPEDNISIDFEMRNILGDLSNVDVIIEGDELYPFLLEESSYEFEFIESGADFSINGVNIEIPDNVPNDYEYTITLDVYSDAQFVNKLYVTFSVNQTYITMRSEGISVTLNSNGNIGFNDFPSNLQGEGFTLNNRNMMFEGGLMLTQRISTNDSVYVADVIRNSSGGKERDWIREKRITTNDKDGTIYSEARYTDKPEGFGNTNVNALGITVNQKAYIVPEHPNSLILEYELTNDSDVDLDSIYAGLFFDWDISYGGADDIIYFNEEENVGIAEIVGEEVSPKVAVKLHSGQEQNFYAFNNDGADNSITVYSSFDDFSKRSAMTNGIGRKTSVVRDASMYSGAGPFLIPSNKSVLLQMSINAGTIKEEIIETANEIDNKIDDLTVFTSVENNTNITIDAISPNPVYSKGEVSVMINCDKQMNASYAIYDNRGRIVKELGNETLYNGYKLIKFSSEGLSSGMYHFGVVCENKLVSIPFVMTN